jgi:hypothetical protein
MSVPAPVVGRASTTSPAAVDVLTNNLLELKFILIYLFNKNNKNPPICQEASGRICVCDELVLTSPTADVRVHIGAA